MQANTQITVTTDSAEDPITLTEAKAWLRIDHTEDDTKITELIKSAVKTVESYIDQAIITKTYLYVTSFTFWDEYGKEYLYLPYSPTTITSVTIYDANDTANALTTTSSFTRKILLGVHGYSARENQAYHVAFTAGVAANASLTPEDIKICLKEVVAYFYEGDCCNKTLDQILSTVAGYVNMNYIGVV